jgi:membrane-associated phospholipid phosphatase
MCLALCAVLVAPARLRPLVATLGVIYALSVGYAVVALVWHFPSDVVGGFLVAAGWTLVAVAGLAAALVRSSS